MSASLEPIDARAAHVAGPPEGALRRFFAANRAAMGTLAVFVVMIGIFMVASPRVFLNWPIYDSVLVTLPVALCLVVPLVFVVTVGEIDLSFPATMGFSAWIFALAVHAGYSPFLGMLGAFITGMAIGVGVGALVVVANLSSLIATLGMNYMLRGFIMIVTQGKSIALLELQDTTAGSLFSGQFAGFPAQIFWALGFVAFAALLFNRHRFGARVHAVGDNPDSAGQMGINVSRVRIATYVFMGLGAALAGVFSTMVNFTWWPTTGDGYLLPAIASVFVGGTPTWGGTGTIVGGAIGALIVSFIQSGVVAAGLSGFYVQFFNGLIIILSLLGHRWNQKRYR
jgi:ribose/xylose/arabinose/galactoside ABC-type transport system permease subunit